MHRVIIYGKSKGKGTAPAAPAPANPAPAAPPAAPELPANDQPAAEAATEAKAKKKNKLSPEDEALLGKIIDNQEALGVIDPQRAPIIRRATHIGLEQLVKEMEARK